MLDQLRKNAHSHCLALLILALPLGLAVAGCGGGGSGSVGSGGTGTLAVRMSDGAGPGITAASITVTKIDANINGQWQTVSTTPQTVDLLALRTTDSLLGSALVPAGAYTQVRVFTSAASVTDANGVHAVTIPSGSQTGIKINLDYTVTPNVITAILLDFNVGKSFVLQGNGGYHLQPVIPAVVQVLSGTVTGTVTDASGPVSGATVTATYAAGSSYPVGTQVNTTATLPDGTYKVWALLPGTYTFTYSFTNPSSVVEIAASSNVVVTANEDTDLGTVVLQ